MISRIMMMLGDYPFSIHTAAYGKLQRNSEYRWKSQQRLGQKPAQQFLGDGADTISLNGVILPSFRGNHLQIPLMRDSATKGEPLIMISGTGFVLGKWCIVKITETGSVFFSDGVSRKIEFSMNLTAYGEDNG